MSFDIGINFRSTAGYVTDGPGETYCIGDAYPTTRGGATFGWEDASIETRDRNSGVDRRFAGVNGHFGAGNRWRLDLPSTGSVDVHVSFGDYSSAPIVDYNLKDDTTTFASVNAFVSAAASFLDATGTEYTLANWAANETPVTRTFASTIFRLVTASDNFNPFTHVRVVQQAASGLAPIVGGGVGSGAFILGA